MDQRMLNTLSQLYPEIPRQDLERIIIVAFGFAGVAGGPAPVAPPIRVPQPPARRGRPPKNKAARGARPAAVAAPAGGDSNAERARQVLRQGHPAGRSLTVPEVEAKLGLQEGHGYPLLARIGAKPVGDVELEDGTSLKTYGLPAGG